VTAYPQPPDPNNPYLQPSYVPQYASPSSARPGAVTVMSILAIIFGSLGVLCGLTALASQLAMLAMGGRNPFTPNMPVMNNTGVVAYGAVAGVVRLLFSAVLLAGGIGALKLRPWARRALIWWSFALIVWATINLAIVLAWVNPITADFVRKTQLQTNPQAAKMMGSMMGPLQVVTAFIGWGLELILPVCFLILWRSPRVVAAFGSTDIQDFQQ